MSSHDSSSLDGSELTLSPPDYSILEDLSSGELRSRTQQVSICYDIIWQALKYLAYIWTKWI
ncbi:hypothetical protein KIN20_008911 [Parelaphostrongylus tenuis]|uniref:Uncharacterized protein n=1 Tax=Parelaphostrongylus tenuis TaxID=148309 RepID=A0AAD5MPP9_PARTN|nr:hypothetical protein KIN20_008911 [Parelaphostrongylus tenuis]